MSLRTLLASLLSSRDDTPAEEDLPERVRAALPEAIDLIVETIDPRLRLVRGYRDKLGGAVRRTVVYMRSLAPDLPMPLELSRKAWATDPAVNTFFATAADVPSVLGRSAELRSFFADPGNIEAREAIALLAMERHERTVLGVALESGMLRRDVLQITVSFADHRIVMPATSVADLRFELGWRIFRRLLDIALERIEAIQERKRDLEEATSLLATRLRRLKGRKSGLESLAEDPDAHRAEIEALERELAERSANLTEAKASLATLDGYIEQVKGVLANPEQHLKLEKISMCVNRMGIKVPEDSTEPFNDLTLTEISVGPNLTRVVAVVRCARDEMPLKEDFLSNALRYL
jgi:hypothetical protein